MSILNKIPNNQVIFISGTPCTGKTTVSSKLNDYLIENGFNTYFIKINDLAIEKGLVLGEDPDKYYKVIDIENLNIVLNNEIRNFLDKNNSERLGGNGFKTNNIVIVEGHLSHLCEGADKMIVLRLNPAALESRLMERNYSESKINENLEAEALAVCSAEAYELYGENTNEIDTTNRSIDDVLNILLDIISGDDKYSVGSIDFMDWFLN